MGKYGINAPPGMAIQKIEDLLPAAKKMADDQGEVGSCSACQIHRHFALHACNCLAYILAWAISPCLQGHSSYTLQHLYHLISPLLCRTQVVLKSQILAGGRGLGKFKNGLQGGVHITTVDKVEELGKQMLNETLVTKQTGPAGKPVNTLYLAAKMQLTNEMYFAILLDRGTAGPMMIGCSEGGTSIEDLAEKYPEKIIKIPVDIREGITDAQANEMVEGLAVSTDKKAAAEQIKNLYNMFTSCDCTMVEVCTLHRSCMLYHCCYAPRALGFIAPPMHFLSCTCCGNRFSQRPVLSI